MQRSNERKLRSILVLESFLKHMEDKKNPQTNKIGTGNKNKLLERLLEPKIRIYLLFLEGYHVMMAIALPL